MSLALILLGRKYIFISNNNIHQFAVDIERKKRYNNINA